MDTDGSSEVGVSWPEVITWEISVWAEFPAAPLVYHRLHPERRGYLMCGLPFGNGRIVRIRVGRWSLCEACSQVRKEVLAAAGHEHAQLALQRRPRTKYDPVPEAGCRRPAGTWGLVWWVVLDADPRQRLHRLHPEQAGQTLCGVQFTAGVTGYRHLPPQWRKSPQRCRTCSDVLGKHKQTTRITDPDKVDRLDRSRARGSSIRALRGGLPTLGRRR